jgi:hypothetical protein
MKDKLKLLQALNRASEHFDTLDQSAKNDHQKYAYAKLIDIYRAVKKHLRKEDIRVIHNRFVLEDGTIVQRTSLVHVPSGECLNDDCIVTPDRPGAQGMAAACTYIKKMALKNLCAIDAGDDDDDGEADTLYKEQLESIKGMIKAHKEPSVLWKDLSEKFDLKRIDDIHPDDTSKIIKYINGLKK